MMVKIADNSDIVWLNTLVNGAYRGEFSKKGWTTEADLLDGFRTDAEALKEMMNEKNSVILKCMNEEGIIIGCVYLQQQKEKLYLGMLTVAPLLQNKGMGKELLRAAERYAKEKQCISIVMTVISVRRELIEWYERHGYKQTGEKKPFHTDSVKSGSPKMHLEFLVLEKKLKSEIK